MVLHIWAADDSRLCSRDEIKDKFESLSMKNHPMLEPLYIGSFKQVGGEVLCSHDKVYPVKEWVGVFEGDSLLPFVVFQDFNSFSLGYNEGVHGLDTPNFVEGFQLSDKQ